MTESTCEIQGKKYTHRHLAIYLLVIYPNVSWNAAYEADQLLALDNSDTNVPVSSPARWLKGPTHISYHVLSGKNLH